ncbi:MAG: electron transport complex subunit RsxC [SAR86 cluster bacterium]|uniref:Ion-translocating oxidoreductase complex subunit C n=1 Tax=SAR86 cluster bacterium TaxID=2030880 RepID=A0A2A4XCT4_9GAMM|nr:MAG: electron transport complex subunit RsxC [SAR86 cluster bacterium]
MHRLRSVRRALSRRLHRYDQPTNTLTLAHGIALFRQAQLIWSELVSTLKQLAVRFFNSDPIFARRTVGGIQPHPFKERSLRSRIMSTPIPQQLTIPIGAEGSGEITLLVDIGDQVRKYQKLAVLNMSVEGCSDVPVHAPTSGVITSIENLIVADHSEQQQLCISLAADGHDEALQLEPHTNYSQLSSADIVSLIRDAGVIGMGGAGFPTADKLSIYGESAIEFLIINAAECEPYITADESLLRERADRVVLGAEILKQASAARRCIIAIEDTKLDAIAALKQALQNEMSLDQTCELVLIPSKYPAGSERQLIQCVTGSEIATGQHPTDNGIVMHNVGTAYAAYEAVVEGKPCISRFTTLCGQALKTPKNFEVLIGTATGFLFELCGIEASLEQRIIVGGSLMGSQLGSDKAAICKTTNCLIAASAIEFPTPEAEQACIRCGFCADACPSNLLPQQLFAFSKTLDTTQLLEHGLLDCIECGACDYVCPSHIPLVSIYKESKKLIETRSQSLERSDYWQQRFQFRQYRVKKEKDQALSRKPDASLKPKLAAEQAVKTPKDEQGFISKEQASRDIAAAVARVKARRNEKNK